MTALTRRAFGRLAALALPGTAWALHSSRLHAAQPPDSRWAGVQVAMNAPYNFGTGNYTSGDEILARCRQLGVSAVELRAQPVEMFLGAPGRGAGAGALGQWRASAPVPRAAEFRRTFEEAGVAIEILKFDGFIDLTDEALDYAFALAKTVGARAISCELPPARVETSRRLGQFADRHEMMIGFHGHAAMRPAHWEQAFAYARHNGANLDLGHFVGGNKTSPIPFLTQHHERITHVHVKDKTLDDKNVPFGEGDTPIREALQTIRDNRWNIQATIEFEYEIPAGSDRMTELARCVEYCKQCLLG
jgi:sugar phosphate isomerase/epimerase